MLGELNFLAAVLAVRMLALVGIVGAGLLAWLSETAPDVYKLGVLAIYCLGVALVVWLASRK